jgi:rod shape-determining protein MreC
VGVVEKVVRDPDRDAFVDVIVKPAAHLDRLDEVLVITSIQPRFSPEQQQDLATSEELKGAEADAIKAQEKASQIMAERLPGLTNPSTPAPTQGQNPAAPGQPQNQATPTAPAAPQTPRLMQPQHPDRYSPGAAQQPRPDATPDSPSKPRQKSASSAAGAQTKSPASPSGLKSGRQAAPLQTTPRRNP